MRGNRWLAGSAAGLAALAMTAQVPAMAGEPDTERHELLSFSCTSDGVTGRASVSAKTQIRTLDMKNNDEVRIPKFSKLRTKIEFKTLRLGGLWRTVDHHEADSVWMERHGQWIHKRYTQPNQGVRGSWAMKLGDSTSMLNDGDTVRAKITVTLDKKPGGKVWKYKRWTNAVTCGGITGMSP